MDALDVRILRELVWGLAMSPVAWNLRMSLAVLARKLSVDEGTVRNRIRGYHESGFIRGWRTILNPTLLGSQELAVWLDVGDSVSKDEVLDAARLLPGVILVASYHGPTLSMILRHRDENAAKRAADLFLRLARAQWHVFGRVPFPPCDLSLTATDLAILRSIEADPRKPGVAVARELGLTTRTVRRRLQRMIDQRAVFALPSLDPKAVRGSLMASLFVTYPAERRGAIDDAMAERLNEHLWHVFHMYPYLADGLQLCSYNLCLPNLAKAREVLRWAHDLRGVAQCRLALFEDLETFTEPFEDEIARLSASA